MLLGDKILGGNSAYSKIGLELCNRLAQAGHKVAHIPTGFANHMGIQSLDHASSSIVSPQCQLKLSMPLSAVGDSHKTRVIFLFAH